MSIFHFKPYTFVLLAMSLSLCVAVNARADLSVEITAQGVVIRAGTDRFVLSAPTLSLKEDDYDGVKPQISLRSENTLVAKYEEADLEIAMTVDKESNTVLYSLSRVPKAKGLRFSMLVPLKLSAEGGKFSFDAAAPRVLPKDKASQYLFSGSAKCFTLYNGAGIGFGVLPPAAWQGLQDNRLFNWETFEYQFLYDFGSHPNETSFSVRFEPAQNP